MNGQHDSKTCIIM